MTFKISKKRWKVYIGWNGRIEEFSWILHDTDEHCRPLIVAMSVVGLNSQEQHDVLQLVAAILHLGNVTFAEDRTNTASIQDERCNVSLIELARPSFFLYFACGYIINLTTCCIIIIKKEGRNVCCCTSRIYCYIVLEFPAYLLEIDPEALKTKLTSRIFDSKWGGKSERLDMTLNVEQVRKRVLI